MFESERSNKDFLTVGSYFPNGGEIYSTGDLLVKIENDLGYDKKEAKALIEECVKQGFITNIGDGVYTR